MACTCTPENNGVDQSMEQYIRAKQQREDQLDYQFVQRIIQELTQSCALNLPIPASAIPPLILQAAQFFWANDDRAVEERWYCLPNSEFNKCGPNKTAKLPDQIISVFGVYKSTDQYSYGVMGDFSLERMLLNSSALASSSGASMSNVYGAAGGYSLMDVTAALYEVNTYKAMFDSPLTYNYNEFSKELIVLGDLGASSLVLQTWQRCKIQDLYNDYYFFRYCVCLGMRSMGQIMGMFEFKLPGGVTINSQMLADRASEEMQSIYEWLQSNHSADYFFNTCTI
jgi:hypothetical protein